MIEPSMRHMTNNIEFDMDPTKVVGLQAILDGTQSSYKTPKLHATNDNLKQNFDIASPYSQDVGTPGGAADLGPYQFEEKNVRSSLESTLQ